ncbi:7011_t:CDS:2, partial [Gigaspora rosea]
RKGHLMSDCRSKKQDKGYNKERNSQKKDSQKTETEKTSTKKKMDIPTKDKEHRNQEKIYSEDKPSSKFRESKYHR